MTIREAINKQCKGNYFIPKSDLIGNYKDAIVEFMYDFVIPASKEICTEYNDKIRMHLYDTIEKYYQHEPNSKLYALSIYTDSLSSEFIFKITAIKSGEGWNISFSQRDGILDCNNLFDFVCIKRIAELENEIKETQEQIDKIKADMNV